MDFALNFSEKISHQENPFSYALKPYFFRHSKAQAPLGSEVSSDKDNICPSLSQILYEKKILALSPKWAVLSKFASGVYTAWRCPLQSAPGEACPAIVYFCAYGEMHTRSRKERWLNQVTGT